MTSVTAKATKLSHKAFRYLLKKFRRKKKRRLIALAREKLDGLEQKVIEASPHYEEFEAEKRRNAALWEEYQEKERRRKNREWMLREEIAQAEFIKKKKWQEEETSRKELAKKRMLAELEEQNAINVASAEKKKQEKDKKEETLKAALSEMPKGNEPWHNPMAPQNYAPLSEKEQCSFFAKTGCCRFGDRCSRGHFHPDISKTLLIRGMYSHFSMDQSQRDDYDTDMGLEFEDSDTYKDFKSFYEDVLPEFKLFGKVTQFKVCCNHEQHLRGNVFVEFAKEEYAVEAFKKFNGRFYAGKQLSCEFSNVKNWKSAICGLFVSKRCPKGNNCNFLHVFRNPDNEFWAADRNLPERSQWQDRRSRSRRSDHRTNGSYRRSDREYPSPRSYRSLNQSQRQKRHYDSERESSDDQTDERRIFESSRSKNGKSKKKKKHHSRSRSRSPSYSTGQRWHKEKKSKKKKKKRKKSSSGHSSSSE